MEAGLDIAASAREDDLHLARAIAKLIAGVGGTCHADQLGAELELRGIDLGPAAGSVFRQACWEFTGQRIRSSRKSNHAREIKVWRYNPK